MEFHPSNLDMNTPFRESVRYGISTEHLNKAQEIFADVFKKHGHESLTAHNFERVMRDVEKDHRWRSLHSGPKLVDAIRDRLKMPKAAEAANDDEYRKAA